MSGYTPNIYDNTAPTDATIAETAQAEFRAIKSFYQGIVDRRSGIGTIVNTAATTTVFSTSVPAGSLGTNKRLRFTSTGFFTNGAGAGVAVSFNLSLGATTILGGFAATIPGNGAFAYKLECTLQNNNTTNSQSALVELVMFTAPSNGGNVQAVAAGFPLGGEINVLAIDTTIANQFTMNTTNSVANATFGIIVDTAVLEWG